MFDPGSTPAAREMATLVGSLNSAAVRPNQIVNLLRTMVKAPLTVDLTSIFKRIGIELRLRCSIQVLWRNELI